MRCEKRTRLLFCYVVVSYEYLDCLCQQPHNAGVELHELVMQYKMQESDKATADRPLVTGNNKQLTDARRLPSSAP
jgi:hypothetical protein